MKYKKIIITLAVFILSLSLGKAQAKISSAGEAINKAGKQRMLTQRIVKSYALALLGDDKIKHQQELESAIRLFENQLTDLKNFAPTDEIKQGLDEVERLWRDVKEIVAAPANRSKVEELRSMSEKVLGASHDIVLTLEDTFDSTAAQIVNLSGRQRMLSQRMANLYMLQALGFEKSRYKNDMRQAMSEFSGALKELREYKKNTPEVRKALMKVYTQFEIFKHSINKNDKNFIPNLIYDASEEILIKMNELTKQYAEFAR